MVTKKPDKKTKTTKRKTDKNENIVENFNKKFHETAGELSALIDKTKKKLDGLDKKQYKKIMVGLAGASVLLAGIVGLKKIKKK